jgi:hypothetical protein
LEDLLPESGVCGKGLECAAIGVLSWLLLSVMCVTVIVAIVWDGLMLVGFRAPCWFILFIAAIGQPDKLKYHINQNVTFCATKMIIGIPSVRIAVTVYMAAASASRRRTPQNRIIDGQYLNRTKKNNNLESLLYVQNSHSAVALSFLGHPDKLLWCE